MNELYHHGIKGMHWGVRRFQNPDGTLTAAGKRREQANSDRATRKEAKKQRIWNAKNASQLSDEDLTKQILRLQREKQLKDLTDQAVAPGRKHAHDLLQRYGDQVLSAAVTAAVTTGATIAITNKMNNKWNPKKTDLERAKDQANVESEKIKSGLYVVDKGKLRRTNKTDKWE